LLPIPFDDAGHNKNIASNSLGFLSVKIAEGDFPATVQDKYRLA